MSPPPRVGSGLVAQFRLPPLDVQITEIWFDPTVPVHYARLPDGRVTFVQVPAGREGSHCTPPEPFPAAGSSHWKLAVGGVKAEYSWPAVYLRENAGGAASRRIEVSFFTRGAPNHTGDVVVKAESADGVEVAEKKVSFANGRADRVALEITGLPTTVRWLSGLELTWFYRPASGSVFRQGSRTQHTLFVVDRAPTAGNMGGAHEDKFLFEIVDWSCRWANGKTGAQAVTDAIWSRFHPVRATHDTHLVYWKNHDRYGALTPQDEPTAIQRQDDADPDLRNAASCIVFDRILIGTLAIQGIAAAEIRLTPDPRSPATFVRGARSYACSGWAASTVVGQGNAASPPSWGSHWIADVQQANGSWKLLDASYGAGPCNSIAPGAAGSAVDVTSYEPGAVTAFECTDLTAGSPVNLPRQAGNPPHLLGTVLWRP